jgi:predicted SnoaL-like aldol condensation-catalyzing enzyme
VDHDEKNKAVVRRFIKEIFEELKPEAIDGLVTDDFVWHRPDGDGDKDFLRGATTRMAGALTNIRFSIDDELADGDRVAVRLTAAATAAADFPGIEDRPAAAMRSRRSTSSGCASVGSPSTGTSTTQWANRHSSAATATAKRDDRLGGGS